MSERYLDLKLSKIPLSIRRAFSRRTLEHATNVEMLEELIWGELVVKLDAYLVGVRQPGKQVEIPTSWWQMFKRDVLGLECTVMVHKLQSWNICPHLTFHGDEKHLKFLCEHDTWRLVTEPENA